MHLNHNKFCRDFYHVDVCVSVICPFTGVLFGFSPPVNTMHSHWERVIILQRLTIVMYCVPFTPRISCFTLSALQHSYRLYHSIHPFPTIVFPHLQLCSVYHRCLVSIFSLSSLHALQPISPQSPFQHLVFSLYQRWSTFHAGLLHTLMPSLCVYAACVLFVSPTCHSETHCFV